MGKRRKRAWGPWWPALGPLGALWLLALPAAAAGQATAPVPLEDPAYALLDRLAAQLPPREMIHGQRPYTRLEFARLTLEIGAALDTLSGADSAPPDARLRYLRELVAALESRFGEERALSAPLGGAALPRPSPPAWPLPWTRCGWTARSPTAPSADSRGTAWEASRTRR